MTMTTASPRARHNGRVDESDPAARPRRRSFTAEYKAAIVDEYDQFPVGAPERGALLAPLRDMRGVQAVAAQQRTTLRRTHRELVVLGDGGGLVLGSERPPTRPGSRIRFVHTPIVTCLLYTSPSPRD